MNYLELFEQNEAKLEAFKYRVRATPEEMIKHPERFPMRLFFELESLLNKRRQYLQELARDHLRDLAQEPIVDLTRYSDLLKAIS